MTAISTPVPEPIPPDPPAIAIVERPVGVGHRMVLFGVMALALLGVAVWVAGRNAPGPAPLQANLQWMFEAALTYPGSDRSGAIHPPPASALTVREVAVLHPRHGPLMATVDMTRPDGAIERVRFRIDVTRRDETWTVTAVPASTASLPAQEAEADSP